MLKVERISDCLRVSGHPRASEWLHLPDEAPEGGFGVAGPDHIWTCNRAGLFRLHSVLQQCIHAEIDLETPLSRSLRPSSRGGRYLYLLQPLGSSIKAESRRLIAIDIPAGRIEAIHDGLPGFAGEITEREDGRLLIDFIDGSSGTPRSMVMLLDPLTGDREQSFVASPRMTPGKLNVHFMSRSPDGRYWIKFDHARLPRHLEPASSIGKVFGRKGGEPRYGLSLQIWEAFPMRLLRRVTAVWLKAVELPDETHLSATPVKPPAAGAPHPMTARRAIWEAISTTLAAFDGDPLEDAPPREAYPAEFADDDRMWKRIVDNYGELPKSLRVVGWQPDGAAFWVDTGNFLTCVGLDGTISPGLFLDRHGVNTSGLVCPMAERYKQFEPLPNRKARAIYETGTAIFDGRLHTDPYAIVSIPTSHDQWQAPDLSVPARVQEAATLCKIHTLERVRNRITIPVAGWSEAGRIDAINALAAEMTGEIYRMAVDREIQVSFVANDRTVSEFDFFADVPTHCPTAVPALRQLVGGFVEASQPDRFLFSVATDGVGLLSSAVHALGCMDRTALPLIKDYGRLVDPGHEYVFAGTTVPAIAKAHGWTADIVDFVFWVIARDFYNTRQDHRTAWRELGLRNAVSRQDPGAFARHILFAIADLMQTARPPTRYGTTGMDRFAQHVSDPDDLWTSEFLRRLREYGPIVRKRSEPGR